MKQYIQNDMKVVNVNVHQMEVFVIINNIGIKINVDVMGKNWFTKEYVIKDLFRIQVIVNVNVTNHKMLENIQIMRIVNVERKQLINQLENLVKISMEMK